MQSIVENKPEDILDFCLKWFKERKGEGELLTDSSSSDEEEQNDRF